MVIQAIENVSKDTYEVLSTDIIENAVKEKLVFEIAKQLYDSIHISNHIVDKDTVQYKAYVEIFP